ncbi:MAG: glycosyl hydrolase [Vulcanimicrobiota bacterium]
MLVLLVGCGHSRPPEREPLPAPRPARTASTLTVTGPPEHPSSPIPAPIAFEADLGLSPDGPAVTEFSASPQEFYLRYRYAGPAATLRVEVGEGAESTGIEPTERGSLLLEAPEKGFEPGPHQLRLWLDGKPLENLAFAVARPAGPISNLPLQPPGPATQRALLTPALEGLRAQAEGSQMAADWRVLAEAAVKAEAFPLAAEAYQREAAIYERSGDANAALVELAKARQYRTEIELFAHRRLAPKAARLARLEPPQGCYIGAFIDRDDNIGQQTFESQTHGKVEDFNQLMGRSHASFFMYRAYGAPFPSQWVEYLKSQNAIAHIAWEPSSLDQVKDDQYLHDFVAAAKAADCPIFIRFAGEMNGDWTGYHGDPKAYRQAFRLVFQAFRQAPRVALIWCPNTVPQTGIDDYYPGDDATDWVGVNFYSVLYLDNERSRPGEHIHPTDLLDYVYRTYSQRKPIAIGEFAATQFSKLDSEPRQDFAMTKLGQLYSALPTRYPRVKMVNWYDCDNMVHARYGRKLNNYLLSSPPELRKAYRQVTSSPYFLGAGQTVSPVRAEPLRKGQKLAAEDTIEAQIRTYVEHPRVYFKLDGAVVLACDQPGAWKLPLAAVKPGKHQLRVLVYDDQDRFVETREMPFEL